MTIMSGMIVKIGHIGSGRKRITVNTGISRNSKKKIDSHTGGGVTMIQTPSSRSIFVRLYAPMRQINVSTTARCSLRKTSSLKRTSGATCR
jgi:hypothetical protein